MFARSLIHAAHASEMDREFASAKRVPRVVERLALRAVGPRPAARTFGEGCGQRMFRPLNAGGVLAARQLLPSGVERLVGRPMEVESSHPIDRNPGLLKLCPLEVEAVEHSFVTNHIDVAVVIGAEG